VKKSIREYAYVLVRRGRLAADGRDATAGTAGHSFDWRAAGTTAGCHSSVETPAVGSAFKEKHNFSSKEAKFKRARKLKMQTMNGKGDCGRDAAPTILSLDECDDPQLKQRVGQLKSFFCEKFKVDPAFYVRVPGR